MKKKKAAEVLDHYRQQAFSGTIRLFFVAEIKLLLLATLTRMWDSEAQGRNTGENSDG